MTTCQEKIAMLAFVGVLALTSAACGGGLISGGSPTAPVLAANFTTQTTTPTTQAFPPAYFVETVIGTGITGYPINKVNIPVSETAYSYQSVPPNSTVHVEIDGKEAPASGNLDPTRDHMIKVFVAIMPGNPAPDFAGNDVNGQRHALSSLRGRYTFLAFVDWACPGARNLSQALNGYYKQYGAKMEVLSVYFAPHMTPDVATPGDLAEWIRMFDITYPLINDPQNANDWYTREYVGCDYKFCSGTPIAFIIDPSGRIVERFQGFDPTVIEPILAARFGG